MSHDNNTTWLEDRNGMFHEYLQDREWGKCERVVNELKRNNYIKEGLELEAELELTQAEENAHNKGSESGVDQWQK